MNSDKFPIVRLTVWRLSITKELMERLAIVSRADWSPSINYGITNTSPQAWNILDNESSFVYVVNWMNLVFIMLIKMSLIFLLCFFLSWFVRSAFQFFLLSS